jgi:viroplasmin and RNaseH domain-containing protein
VSDWELLYLSTHLVLSWARKNSVVAIGRKPGIYLTWPECQEQVLGYPKAAAFETMEKAMEYYYLFLKFSHCFMVDCVRKQKERNTERKSAQQR